MYPWIAGPLLAGQDALHFVRSLTPVGALAPLIVEGVRRFGLPLAVAVPAGFLGLGAAIAKCLAKGVSTQARPFELPHAWHAGAECGSGIDMPRMALGEDKEPT